MVANPHTLHSMGRSSKMPLNHEDMQPAPLGQPLGPKNAGMAGHHECLLRVSYMDGIMSTCAVTPCHQSVSTWKPPAWSQSYNMEGDKAAATVSLGKGAWDCDRNCAIPPEKEVLLGVHP